MSHCGTCKHTAPDPDNLNNVVCFGAPPAVVISPVQLANGQRAIAEVYKRPCLPKTERACAVYEAKEVADGCLQEPFRMADQPFTIEESI